MLHATIVQSPIGHIALKVSTHCFVKNRKKLTLALAQKGTAYI